MCLMTYKSNKNIVYSCKFHVVWCTKYRRKLLSSAVEARLKRIAAEVCAEHDVEIIEIECDQDHVHILLDVDPQYGVHRAVKSIKGRTSRLLRQEFPSLRTRVPTLWTNSYFVSSVGGSPLAEIKKYIQDQKVSD